MRLGDLDTLKKDIEENAIELGGVLAIEVDCAKALIDNAPTVEQPQGEWINHRNDYGHNIADCSLCGKAMQWHDEDEDGIPRYCWYCGAKMSEGETK